MKKRLFMLFFITILMLVFSAPLVAQPEDEEEEGPIQARPNPIAWSKFSRMARISSIVITRHRGNRLTVNMRSIRSALEKAGISEPVKIQLRFQKGKMNLGTFKPTFIRTKSSGPARKGKTNRFSLRFRSMGPIQSAKYDGIDGESKDNDHGKWVDVLAMSPRGSLIFLNGKGGVKAVLKTRVILR